MAGDSIAKDETLMWHEEIAQSQQRLNAVWRRFRIMRVLDLQARQGLQIRLDYRWRFLTILSACHNLLVYPCGDDNAHTIQPETS